jgi:hypothetical protein
MDEAPGFPVAVGFPVAAGFPVPAGFPAAGAAADGDMSACEPASGMLEAAGWNLTASSAAIPATVPPRVRTARSNGCLLLEIERLVVDVAAADASGP